eukprot:2356217-Rhodomonas_salina.2
MSDTALKWRARASQTTRGAMRWKQWRVLAEAQREPCAVLTSRFWCEQSDVDRCWSPGELRGSYTPLCAR